MMNSIVILAFSGRNEGNCANISNYLMDYHKRTNIRNYTIHNLTPCGNCNYECLKPSQTCPELSAEYTEVMDSVCSSDLVYFVVPNYCGFPCAAYFSFNEHSVGYFNMDKQIMERYLSVKKRFIIVSNTENPEFKSAMQQQTTEEPDILYLKTSKYRKQSIAGDMMDAIEAKTDLKSFLDAYKP